MDVISGEEEARLDFVGATRTNNIRDGVLIDIGGGSTEIAEFLEGAVISAASMPVGSLNLYVKHVEDVFPTEKDSPEKSRWMCRRSWVSSPFPGREPIR